MESYPAPPSNMAVMDPELQRQFLMMQYPPVLLLGLYCLWRSWQARSFVPILIFAGGGIAYLAEPLVNVLGLVWFPQQGIDEIWGSLGRKVPVFGFFAYLWFLGGMSYVIYERMLRGITARGIWLFFAGFVVLECCLEIPGLNIGAFAYYGNQPFVVFKFPVWWAFCNSVGPIVAGALCYRILPLTPTPLRFLAIYAVCLSNALAMMGAGLPTFFALNTTASPFITHLAGAVTIGLTLFFIYLVTLVVRRDSPVSPTRA